MRERLKRCGFLWRLATAPLRCEPHFIIIGANKCGTTSLSRYLLASAHVEPALRQEVHYFDLNFFRSRAWHKAHFPTRARLRYREAQTGSTCITGTSAPYYLFHPEVPSRMVAQGFVAKFIVLLRNPVERAFSHYKHQVKKGRENLSFEEALEKEAQRLEGEEDRLRDPRYKGMNHRRYSYLARGRYAEQLRRWLTYFPRERFLVVKSEDLFAKPGHVLEKVASFLGIQCVRLDQYPVYNANPAKGAMDSSTRRWLSEYFGPYNQELYDLLGRDLGWD